MYIYKHKKLLSSDYISLCINTTTTPIGMKDPTDPAV